MPKRAAGRGNAAARRILSAEELLTLTRLDDRRSLLAIAQTAGVIAAAVAFGLWMWPSPWVLLSVLAIGVAQHGLFILVHEAAHYRLLACHLEHHLYPAVPHDHLPALHRLLVARRALEDAEVRDVRSTLGMVFAPRRVRVAAAAAG